MTRVPHDDSVEPRSHGTLTAVPHAWPLPVAAAFGDLSRQCRHAPDLASVVDAVAHAGRRLMGDRPDVIVTLGSPEMPERVATLGPLAESFDGAQRRAGQGPAADAWTLRCPVITADVVQDPRWPALAREDAVTPVRSVLAVPVGGNGVPTGVLTLLSGASLAFDEPDMRLVEMYADAVAAVIGDFRADAQQLALVAQLRSALVSRAVIDQAKGILMARRGCDGDTALALLSSASQRANIKLREVARLLVEDARTATDVEPVMKPAP